VGHEKEPDADNGQTAEDRDGLGGMEFDPRTLVNQQEDKTGHPTERVAQQAGNIFSKTFGV
jgi:hypothetical protein